MLPTWEGAPPESPVTFAVCDAAEFIAHGAAFVRSAYRSKVDVHLHIINPTSRCTQGIYRLMGQGGSHFSVTRETTTDDPYVVKIRALNCLLSYGHPILMVDIQTLINKDFKYPKTHCCFYKKDGVVSKDILYASKIFQPHLNRFFVGYVMAGNGGDRYFQSFVNDVDNLHKGDNIFFDNSMMNVVPDDNSSMWLKSEDKRYVDEKKSYGLLLSTNRGGRQV